jgi:KDO2-lipid IV(A) lauroyltransferase
MAKTEIPAWQGVLVRVGLTVGGTGVMLLPRWFELFAGRLIGRVVFALAPKRRLLAAENIARCLPELSSKEQAALLWRNCEHWGILFFEMLHMFSPFEGHFERYVRRVSVIEGYEHWKKAHDKGKGVIFAGNHVGNWEIVSAQAGLAGMDMMIVTRNLTPKWLHEKMISARRSVKVEPILPPKTLPTVLKSLRAGASLVFAMDQYAPPDAGGVKARFFGYSVNTLGAIALFAKKTGAAIVPGSSYRDKKGIIHVFVDPEIPLDVDPVQATQIIVDKTEDYIRAHPEQWTWGHRRFKLVDWTDRVLRPLL